jgi:hypothetical protein
MVRGRHLSSPMRSCPQLRAESLSATTLSMSRAEEGTAAVTHSSRLAGSEKSKKPQ